MSPYGEPSSGSYSTSTGHYELRFYPKYHFDFVVNILPVPQIESYGAPVKIRRTEIATFGLAIILFSFFLLHLHYIWKYGDFGLFFLSGFIGSIILLAGLFSEKTANYEWQGERFAEILNRDDVLNDTLRKIKAPPIKIRGNHIYLGEDKLPSQTLLLSIERIAEHIVVASANWTKH